MSIELDEHVNMVELVKICQKIDGLYHTDKFDTVNEILLDVTKNPTSIVEMCAHLRYASCASERLKDWKLIVNTARDQLIARDYDPKRILRGIDESQ